MEKLSERQPLPCVGEESARLKPARSKTFSRAYFKEAAALLKNVKILAFAAVICALRIAVKSLSVPIAPGVYLSFDCYVNAVGAMVYGPIFALLVGAVSDTLGAVLFPKGAYFFPFIAVEMLSGFIFALFLWRKKLTAPRLLLAKFTVNFLCNLVLNPLIMKWYYYWLVTVKGQPQQVYYMITGVRIVKNLAIFPLEAVLICVLLNALLPGLKSLGYADKSQKDIALEKKELLLCGALTVLSVAIVLFYVFFLRDFVAAHNIKLF